MLGFSGWLLGEGDVLGPLALLVSALSLVSFLSLGLATLINVFGPDYTYATELDANTSADLNQTLLLGCLAGAVMPIVMVVLVRAWHRRR